MAMEDVRGLNAQIAELRQRLTEAPAGGSGAAAAGGALDWEAEKRRILASLESAADDEQEDEEQEAERLKIEDVIRTTDKTVAEKDREISELKQLLEDQSGSLGSVAVGAAALGEMVDSDAVIQEERENLKRLQDEWREKLRQAEIDISVERAKMARERTQIEEKLRLLEAQGSSPAPPADEPGAPSSSARRRWLAQLGLKDPDK
jgi:hypothetical protein